MVGYLAPEEVAVLKKVYSFIAYVASPNGTPKDVLLNDANAVRAELREVIERHRGAAPVPPHVYEVPDAQGCGT